MSIYKNEITKEMLEKAMQCKTAEDLIAFAKTEGVDLTKEEAEAYFDELSECCCFSMENFSFASKKLV